MRRPESIVQNPTARARLAALATRALDAVVPGRCCDCGGELAERVGPIVPRTSPLCPRCEQGLAWWRAADGCPRCGFGPGRTGPPADPDDPWSGDQRDWPSSTRSRLLARACPGCLAEGSALHACHAIVRYEGAVRRWLPAFKNPPTPLGPSAAVLRAIDHLAAELARSLQHAGPPPLDLLIAMPLHRARHLRRGFNHSDRIASTLARRLALPVCPSGLARVRATRPQASLSGDARRQNVRGAFRARRRFDPEIRIGLVDDVLTTGQTLESAADALLEAGAFEVRGLTLAATLPPRARRPRPSVSPA